MTGALAGAAPWLRDGDVLVVTSKVLSKCEGRLIPAPQDPEERDTLRRRLVDAEAVRTLARKGRTLITENKLGIVQAASGVDGSNIGTDELALLPVDPDGSAAALRAGLREHAQRWISTLHGLTLARLLIGYLLLRQLLAMLGLTGVAGPAQTVRPLLAPMGEAAAGKILPTLDDADRDELRAVAAATDNIGRFFGEDVFIALGAVLLIQSFYAQHGIELTPLSIALWALPIAIAAFVIQSVRVWLYQRRLQRRAANARTQAAG